MLMEIGWCAIQVGSSKHPNEMRIHNLITEYATSEKYQNVLKDAVKKTTMNSEGILMHIIINHDLDSGNNADVLHGLKKTLNSIWIFFIISSLPSIYFTATKLFLTRSRLLKKKTFHFRKMYETNLWRKSWWRLALHSHVRHINCWKW